MRNVECRLSLYLLLAVVALGASAERSLAAPHVVVIASDDAGYADFGFMDQFTGSTTAFKTPNLDALAQQSIVFSNAYVSSSACSPSRSGLLTGRYQQKFGMDYNIASATNPLVGVPSGEVMLPAALKPLGYTTGAIGKWHVGQSTLQQPQNKGFDEFYGLWEGGRPYFYDVGNDSVKVRRGTAPIAWQNETSFNNVPPDPVLGRHLTDAIGDEASKFIANHAGETNPFFLYVAFNAPHSPYGSVKEQDLAEFDSSGLTGLRKNAAALTYGLDRNVGNILARINDPNGDGNMSDSIANDTIVVFINDNGGNGPTDPQTGGEMVHSNGVLRGYKGEGWEGGIRVPMLIRAPNATPGTSAEPVMALDLFPTIVSAANGVVPANIDGENLMPLLQGTQTGAVHDALFWRGGFNYHMAVRKGEWKLVKGAKTAAHRLYRLNANGSGEEVFMESQQPQKFQELIRDFVNWEATLAKPTQTDSLALNRFDAFRFRTDVAANTTWRTASAWLNEAQPATTASLMQQDSYANAVLVFHPRNDSDFTSTNNISRIAGIDYSQMNAGLVNPSGLAEFMLNELRFDDVFSGAANRSGTLNGSPLMFVKNLSGQGARLALNSTHTGGNQFAFNVNMDVVLHDNLEITGNSTVNYVVGGQIRNFFDPRSVTKNGTSTITLAGNNTYSGATTINQGTLRVDGANAALASTSGIQIGPQGALALASGLIRTPSLQIAAGGAFSFTGGVLEAGEVSGSLLNGGGEFRPGLSATITGIAGNFTQTAGAMALEIGGAALGTFDQLIVAGNAQLDGNLNVSLLSAFSPSVGDVFQVITSYGGLSGQFDAVNVPTLTGGRKWTIQYMSSAVILKVVTQLDGDFDGSGIVDGGDLQFWKGAYGNSLNGSDFLTWQRQLGTRLVPTSGATAIPEPAALKLAGAALVLAATWRRRGAAVSRLARKAS